MIFITKKKYGCNREDSNYDYVNQHLGKYIEEEREKLILSKRHDFLLMKGSKQSLYARLDYCLCDFSLKLTEKYGSLHNFAKIAISKSFALIL